LKQSSILADWPPHLHAVFAAIDKAMGDAQLQPAVLDRVSYPIIPDHRITVAHLSGDQAKPGGNRYVVTIEGPVIDGRWTFRSGTLQALARSAAVVTDS
jgi:hypothetical protein